MTVMLTPDGNTSGQIAPSIRYAFARNMGIAALTNQHYLPLLDLYKASVR